MRKDRNKIAETGIVIVEDTNLVSIGLKKTLEPAGYNILRIATSGAEAVEKAFALYPEIILLHFPKREKSPFLYSHPLFSERILFAAENAVENAA